MVRNNEQVISSTERQLAIFISGTFSNTEFIQIRPERVTMHI
jgi:hypothetical protein